MMKAQSISRVMVATDRSETAERAVRWAADLAARNGAELWLLQVLLPHVAEGPVSSVHLDTAREELSRSATEFGDARGHAMVVIDPDPAQAIVDAAEREGADVLVVGNVGMSGRTRFLLGNVPNRISHTARCTVIIVNTAHGEGPGRDRRSIPPADEESVLFARALRIGRILVKAGFREVLARPDWDDPATLKDAAQRLRLVLDELGPTFAKLGQILSTRPDLLPPQFIEELATLQERVTPLTEAQVVAVMEEELGVPWEDVFASIQPEPLAAGTIAQVHKATLESGEHVVVKIQRPNAESEILQDLGLLERFAEKAVDRPMLRRVFDMPAVIEHLSTSLRRELDFRREAANIARMAEVLTPYSRLAVPRVYTEYSTARLLVMEEIKGVPIREAPAGDARQEAARQLLESYYHQVMKAGFFHADPHPGNLKWWNDTIYFLDLGMVGELDARVQQLVLLVLLSFAQKDGAFLSEVVLMLAAGGSDREVVDLPGFQADLQRLVDHYRNVALRDIQLGPVFQEVTQIAINHNVRLPASLLLTGKAFAQMQLIASELEPSLDPFAVAQSFVVRNTTQQVLQGIDLQRLVYEAQKTRFRMGRLLESLEGTLGGKPGAHLQVDFRGTEHLEQTLDRASRRLSIAFGIGGALVAIGGLGSAFMARILIARQANEPRWRIKR